MKTITNEEFDTAYQNADNRGIIFFVLSKYSHLINDPDELEACGLRGLWKCLSKYDDTRGQKFTSTLYNFVKWECQGIAKDNYNILTTSVRLIDKEDKQSGKYELIDFLQSLKETERDIIESYFVGRYTYLEISQKYGKSVEWVRQQIKKIREFHENNF